MIKPENRDKLREEITQKTGLKVLDIKIEGLNLMENCVTLCVYYADENTMKVTKSSNLKSLKKPDDKLSDKSESMNQFNGIL